jgi:hypothetical protein
MSVVQADGHAQAIENLASYERWLVDELVNSRTSQEWCEEDASEEMEKNENARLPRVEERQKRVSLIPALILAVGNWRSTPRHSTHPSDGHRDLGHLSAKMA